jgi:hypothetical protein
VDKGKTETTKQNKEFYIRYTQGATTNEEATRRASKDARQISKQVKKKHFFSFPSNSYF